MPRVIRIAAVADIHVGPESAGVLGEHFAGLRDEADVLFLLGDLTRDGDPADAEILAAELQDIGVPVVAVLGNHDYHADQVPAITAILRDSGVHVLNRSSVVLNLAGQRVAIAGTKGIGGGFNGALASDQGEPEMRAWIHHAEQEAEALEDIISGMVGDIRIVLLHYAPIIDTLAGERLELYPFCGNSMLGAAIDRAGADLVLHGHAHHGSPAGVTHAGIPVRNVARPVIRKPYALLQIDGADEAAAEPSRERQRVRRKPRWIRRATRLARRDATRSGDDARDA